MSKIHPTAIIDKTAEIGKDVEIGPYTVIGKSVKIGDNTYIGPNCIIEYATIGKSNKILGHASIGLSPQDYKYANEETYVEIGDNNIIREFVSIHRGTPGGRKITKVGSGCFLMANSHIGHDCIVGDKVIMVNSAAAAGHVIIENNAIISGLVGIHQFTRIGSYVMLSGGAMANQDIIPYVIAQGDRAKPVSLNLVGLKRAGFSPDAIKKIKYAFKTLFYSNFKFDEALKKLEDEKLGPEVDNIIRFCRESKRGIARPRRGTVI